MAYTRNSAEEVKFNPELYSKTNEDTKTILALNKKMKVGATIDFAATIKSPDYKFKKLSSLPKLNGNRKLGNLTSSDVANNSEFLRGRSMS